MKKSAKNTIMMYVGCFTMKERGGNGDGGIGVFKKEPNGSFERVQTVPQFNPSYLAMSEDKKFLYGVQGKGHEIYSYAIDEETGRLSFINSIKSGAGLACEVCNGYLYVVAGTVQIFQLNEDGSIGDQIASFSPKGEVGPITGVQHAAQPHHILHDIQKHFFAVPCRGMDSVHVYFHDIHENKVDEVSVLHTYGGSYPRHIAFHPTKPVAYQLLERYGMVLMCHYGTGVLTPVEMLPTVPPEFVGLFNAAGEIAVHPNGELLAISNRGANNIAMFHILEDGRLQLIGWTKEHVSIPRFFTFDDEGGRLYCANIGQCPPDRPITKEGDAIPGTGDITVYDVNSKTGELTFTGERIPIPAPSCILFKTLTY